MTYKLEKEATKLAEILAKKAGCDPMLWELSSIRHMI